MIKVLLVDDEVLAMQYLQNLIEWEEHGYQIIGCATSGKRALELYKKYNPEIVISDIKMVGMDGLELTRQLKEIYADVIVILLSAYKDFEYAKKGIRYGVENYLLKHELSEETLLQELNGAVKSLERNSQKERIFQKYFMDRLIYNGAVEQRTDSMKLGNRFVLMMLHRNSLFRNGNFYEENLEPDIVDSLREVLEESVEDTLYYVSDVKITSNNLVILYRIEKEVSKYKVNMLIEQKSGKVCEALKAAVGLGVNVLYSYEITQMEISSIFQMMAGQVRCSMYWKKGECCALSKLQAVLAEEKLTWDEQMEDLKNAVYEKNQELESLICYLFDRVTYPNHRIEALREMIFLLENILRGIENREGVKRPQSNEKIYKAEEIKEYYITCYSVVSEKIHERERGKYSNLVLSVMRYIRKNYQSDLNLELIGEVFQMNGVYIGQTFKKEVGTTFLKYLTNCRIEEAKRLLELGEYNIAEVAEKVGYKTSQYFSQVFIKSEGMKPQEYKKWCEKKERKNI